MEGCLTVPDLLMIKNGSLSDDVEWVPDLLMIRNARGEGDSQSRCLTGKMLAGGLEAVYLRAVAVQICCRIC